MSNLASSEMRKISVPSKTTEEVKDPSEILADNQKLLAEIHSLKDTNEQLEKQLRFQTQVRLQFYHHGLVIGATVARLHVPVPTSSTSQF